MPQADQPYLTGAFGGNESINVDGASGHRGLDNTYCAAPRSPDGDKGRSLSAQVLITSNRPRVGRVIRLVDISYTGLLAHICKGRPKMPSYSLRMVDRYCPRCVPTVSGDDTGRFSLMRTPESTRTVCRKPSWPVYKTWLWTGR